MGLIVKSTYDMSCVSTNVNFVFQMPGTGWNFYYQFLGAMW
jgi:hypothetical protein